MSLFIPIKIMKKMFLSAIITIIAFSASAETNYYPNPPGTITRDGYTYKYRLKRGWMEIITPTSGFIELYNADNSYHGVKLEYRDGRELTFEMSLGIKDIEDRNLTRQQTQEMVNNLFSSQQRSMLKGYSMNIHLRINPDTGKILDVYFALLRADPFVYIPVETFRNIELALKRNLTFTVTEKGRELNFVGSSWTQIF